MVPLSNLLTFALAAAVLIAVPGPSVLFVIGRSLALGRKGGLLSVLGNALGMIPQIVAVALGVGVALAQSVLLFTIVKFAGAAYLVFLGVQAIRHRGRSTTAADPSRSASTFRVLREGFIVGATNPKSLVFFVAVLPQFVEYTSGAIPLQLAVLGAVFLLIALVSDSIWAIAAGTARQWFARSPRRISTLSTTGGAMMIALGGTLALTGTKNWPGRGGSAVGFQQVVHVEQPFNGGRRVRQRRVGPAAAVLGGLGVLLLAAVPDDDPRGGASGAARLWCGNILGTLRQGARHPNNLGPGFGRHRGCFLTQHVAIGIHADAGFRL